MIDHDTAFRDWMERRLDQNNDALSPRPIIPHTRDWHTRRRDAEDKRLLRELIGEEPN